MSSLLGEGLGRGQILGDRTHIKSRKIMISTVSSNFTNSYPQTDSSMTKSYENPTDECDSCTVIYEATVKRQIEDGNLGWWIEIFTAQPACIYHFGAFEDTKTAAAALQGFTEDLLDEGASGLVSRINFHSPQELTIDLDQGKMNHFPPGVNIL
jgi:hypothetical protein